MSKQDRQGVRTAVDLERKYDLGGMKKTFAEATGAQTGVFEALDRMKEELTEAMEKFVQKEDYEKFSASIEIAVNEVKRTLQTHFNFTDTGVGVKTRILPVLIPADADFDTVTAPNLYIGGSPKTFKYKNCPVESGTFSLDVRSCGDEGQILQRLTTCNKTESKTFERFHYQSGWGAWVCVSDSGRKGIATDAGWVPLTIAEGFVVRGNDETLTPVYKVTGNVVTVCGVLSNAAEMTSTSSGVVIASGIPEAYRPKMDHHYVCQGSGMNRWQCSVKTDGTLMLSRYGTTTQGTIAANAWLPFSLTYQY